MFKAQKSCDRNSFFFQDNFPQVLQEASGCSAVGSALRSGRRGRPFESDHPDIRKGQQFLLTFSYAGMYPISFSLGTPQTPRPLAGRLKPAEELIRPADLFLCRDDPDSLERVFSHELETIVRNPVEILSSKTLDELCAILNTCELILKTELHLAEVVEHGR